MRIKTCLTFVLVLLAMLLAACVPVETIQPPPAQDAYQYQYSSLVDLLLAEPGVVAFDGGIYITGHVHPPTFVVNGELVDGRYVSHLEPENVLRINVVRYATAQYAAPGGVIELVVRNP